MGTFAKKGRYRHSNLKLIRDQRHWVLKNMASCGGGDFVWSRGGVAVCVP